jgi:hypothetical protein
MLQFLALRFPAASEATTQSRTPSFGSLRGTFHLSETGFELKRRSAVFSVTIGRERTTTRATILLQALSSLTPKISRAVFPRRTVAENAFAKGALMSFERSAPAVSNRVTTSVAVSVRLSNPLP